MSKRSYLFMLFALSVMSVMGQSPLDAFKYIIVPKKFDFLKEENQYRVNSTTKYLFEQNGFETLIQGEQYPEDLIKNPCLAATADILDDSSLLTTKLYVLLRDCHDQEVYRSEMGKSKEKSYAKTYIDALDKAFVSIGALSYQYRPELAEAEMVSTAVPASQSAEVKKEVMEQSPAMSNEVMASKPPVAEPPVQNSPVAQPAAALAVVPSEEKEVATEPEAVAAPVHSSPGANSFSNDKVSFLLVAQGNDLVAYVIDSKNSSFEKGEVIGTLSKTSLPNVYRASWKNMDKAIEQTTAYFDEQGNLKIDVQRDGKIEVLTFDKD